MTKITGWLILIIVIAIVWGIIALYRRKPSNEVVSKTTSDHKKGGGDKKGGTDHEAKSGGSHKKWLPKNFAGFVGSAIAILVVLFVVIPMLVSLWHWIIQPSSNANAVSPARVIIRAPSMATNQLSCPLWSRGVTACRLVGTNRIMQAPGLPAGLTFCMSPKPDPVGVKAAEQRWASISAVFDNGTTLPLDPAKLLTNVAGYDLTPLHDGQVVVYWLSDSQDCTQPNL